MRDQSLCKRLSAASLCALTAALITAVCAACAPPQAAPTPIPSPSPAPSATPRQVVVRVSEQELGQLATELALGHSPLVTQVSANVQADGEVYWTFQADVYLGDTMFDLKAVKGTTVGLEGRSLNFAQFWLQFYGLYADLQSTPRWLPQPLGAALEALEGDVSAALNQRWRDEGWVPQAAVSDDSALIVTLREQ